MTAMLRPLIRLAAPLVGAVLALGVPAAAQLNRATALAPQPMSATVATQLDNPMELYLAKGEGAATGAYAEVTHADLQRRPMIFFVAKGPPDACGPGCREWIAAEGTIDPEAGLRFREFVAALPRRDLPIFFNSTGGSVGQSVALGIILREHRMTAGVGRTVPEGCRNAAAIDACRRVMESKREHGARLVTGGARCLSGCVYAFIGAAVRHVARDAQLGIHSVRVVPLPGRRPTGPAPGIGDVHHLLKSYMAEMGIDPALIDAAAKISPDRVRYVSRDEMARLGIETRGFYESAWVRHEDIWKQFTVLKLITQAKGADGKEYRTSSVRLRCLGAADRIWLGYRREVASNEVGAATAVRMVAGDSDLVLQGVDGNGASDLRSGMASAEFLRSAVSAPSIVVTETFTPAGSTTGWSRVIKLATNGLSKALEELRRDCAKPARADASSASSGR
jgi:hypothetical protein